METAGPARRRSPGPRRLTGALLIAQGVLLLAAIMSAVGAAQLLLIGTLGTATWAVAVATPSTALGVAFVRGRCPRRTTIGLEVLAVIVGVPAVFAYTHMLGTYDLSMRMPEALLISAIAVSLALSRT